MNLLGRERREAFKYNKRNKILQWSNRSVSQIKHVFNLLTYRFVKIKNGNGQKKVVIEKKSVIERSFEEKSVPPTFEPIGSNFVRVD